MAEGVLVNIVPVIVESEDGRGCVGECCPSY